MTTTDAWHFIEAGVGRPLILLHGIGMSHATWSAVIPHLAPSRRVLAFDVAGFGSTPPLPAGTAPTIGNLVDALEASLRAIGIDRPVDIAGNSLGGALALEAARRGAARSAVAISPIGLWRTQPPLHVAAVFATLRFGATRFPRLLKAMLRKPTLRTLALAVPMSVESWRMPARAAFGAIDDLAAAMAFEATFQSTKPPFSGAGTTVPVTVAFGDRDLLLTKSARRRDQMPPGTRWSEEAGWGHVPLWIDPLGVARLILEGTR